MLRSQHQFFIILGLSLITALLTLRIIPLGLSDGFEGMLPHINIRPVAFLVHISSASVALAIGGFQFWKALRNKHLNWHRWIGRVYVLAVISGSVSGFLLGLFALGGPVSQVGFILLSILWGIVTILAIVRIRSGNVQAHRAWMYRSFALTLSGVTLRLQLSLFFLIGIDYTEASVWLAWTAWVPNLLWVEWKLYREKTNSVPKMAINSLK